MSQLFVDRGEGLAVAAPGSEELHEGWLARLEDYIVEVGRDEVEDFGACADQRRQRECKERKQIRKADHVGRSLDNDR